ncbi:MAG TPA: HD domain-containing protein [Brevefilum sp.]|nr:HD domain-containing protein [Brevefilum sp.]HOR19948.1 HD domain-containing protein [Brevefilum sp.]HPL70276.1 HD domain-containing protein [Brevefilum sp.]
MTHPFNLDIIFQAIIFATRKHNGQVRKGELAAPYIIHPLAVAREIFTTGQVDDPQVLVAAILHDTIEDTDTKPEEICALFGEEVLNIVLEVSDDKLLDKMCRKQRQVINAPHLSYLARIVKLADKLVNCRDILYFPPYKWPLTRRQEYIQWSADVIAQIRGTNANLETAFDELLIKAQARLEFHLEPFELVDNRPWGPGATDKCA